MVTEIISEYQNPEFPSSSEKIEPNDEILENENTKLLITEFNNYIKKHHADSKSSDYNFISMHTKIKHKFDKNFWKLYTPVIQNTNKIYYFAEKPMLDYSILRFDIDIRKTKKKSETQIKTRLYDSIEMKKIITYIHTLILEHTTIQNKQCNIESYNCCVFEKNAWTDKDGFHLLFPHLFVKNEYQNDVIVPALQQYILNLSTSEKKFDVDKIANLAHIIYGSAKSKVAQLYKLTVVYDKLFNVISNTPYLSPEVFSINKVSNIIYGKNSVKPIFKKLRLNSDIEKDYEFIKATRILDLLPNSYAEECVTWIDVGITLFNIGCGEGRFLDLWKGFSSRCMGKYNEQVCINNWNRFEVRNKTIGSLLYYLKKGSETDFQNIVHKLNSKRLKATLFPFDVEDDETRESQIKFLKKQTCNIQNFDVAYVFWLKYRNDLIYTSTGKSSGQWYKFDVVKWLKIDELDLEKQLYEEMGEYFNTILDELLADLSCDNDQNVKNYIEFNKSKISGKLRDITFIKKCLQACKTLFNQSGFGSKLDANKYLLACENGVLDLKLMQFREATPEDYLTLSTKLYYNSNPSMSQIQEVKGYFEQLFGHITENVLEIYSSTLIGDNAEKHILVALGKTNTGKSQLLKFLQKALGDYLFIFPNQIAYSNRNLTSAGAREDLANSDGKRLGVINELKAGIDIDADFLKQISGGDSMVYRKNYGAMKEILPMFKIYISTNFIPRIPQEDIAMWNRLLIIPFETQFGDKNELVDLNNNGRAMQKIKKMDDKFLELAPVLLWLLFDTYKKIANNGEDLFICDYIKDKCKAYRDENNPVCRFLKDKLIIHNLEEQSTTIEKHFISLTNVFDSFKEWFKNYYPGTKQKYSKSEFVTEFENKTFLKLEKCIPPNGTRKIDGWNKLEFIDGMY
jgi:P4 family phage/plasmid primase-like protien